MMQRVRLRFDPDARPPLQARLLAELHAIRDSAPGSLAWPARTSTRWPRRSMPSWPGRGARPAACGCSSPVRASAKKPGAHLSLLEGLMRSVRQSGLDTRLQESLADLAAQTPRR